MTSYIVRPTWNRKVIFLVVFAAFAVPKVISQQSATSTEQQSTVPVSPMRADAHPSFEVATIKPADPNVSNGNFRIGGHRISIENQTVSSLISIAFALHQKQIVDGPGWFSTQRYDIVGQADLEGVPNLQQIQEMLQKLLVSRFDLRFHRGKRELSVYAIRVAKGGAKLARSAESSTGLPTQTGTRSGSEQIRKFTNNSMSDLALGMLNYLDRPVVDETQLTGRYDFTLKWTPDDSPTAEADTTTGLFTAFQEQLGLKLEPSKSPTDVLIIDHCEKPSEN